MTSPARVRWRRAGVLLAWLVMLGLLLRFEVYPEFFTHRLPGYRSWLSEDVLLQDSWARVLMQGKPVGSSYTSVEIDEDDPLKHYTVVNRVNLRLKAMGFDQPVYVDTTAYVDITHTLQGFQFELSSSHYGMKIRGKRTEGTRFVVFMSGNSGSQKMNVDIPDDVILYSPMTELALKKLRPGNSLTFRTFDPATLSPTAVTIRALREERVMHGGVEKESTVLSTEYQGMSVTSWVDAEGTLLRQETPMGWTIESCTASEALAAVRAAGSAGDAISDLAVRVQGEIADPEFRPDVHLRLSGAPLTAAALASNRQMPEARGDGTFDLRVRRARLPLPEEMAPLNEEDRARYLAATPFIQAEDPAIVAEAQRITAGISEAPAQVAALREWVYSRLTKEVTVSLPSAADVLRERVGDCNEHTYLFVALARAAGIPAKVMVGLAYHEGGFYYHAWPAVHLGDWVEVDPTWNQEFVDATHIRLVEGELQEQVAIIHVVGRLKIEVLHD